jgi:hypothetical protein
VQHVTVSVVYTPYGQSKYVTINYISYSIQPKHVGALNGYEIIPLANSVIVILFGRWGELKEQNSPAVKARTALNI